MADALRTFLRQYLKLTEHPLYVCSLPNKRGDKPGERHILSRDVDAIAEFARKWDRDGRGLFYCVNPIREGERRLKANVAEVVVLQVDVDGKSIGCSLDHALGVLNGLAIKPSRIHKSGNGLHALWFLSTPASVDEAEEALKGLRRVLSGDAMVAHAAALLRMPGSHNTKNGAWTEVTVVRAGREGYTVSDVAEWLARNDDVLIEPKDGPAESEDNPFLRAAAEQGFRPPMDVKAKLSEMADGNVHDTQLKVVASMLSTGHPVDEVIKAVMEATRKVGDDTWDWKAEERAVQGMCQDWLKKHPPKVVRMQSTEQVKPKPEKGKKKEAHVVLGNGIIKAIRDRGEDLIYCSGQLWRYRDGLWASLDPAEEKDWIEREAEAGCRDLRVTSTQRLVGETRAWLRRNPDLHREGIAWDGHGKIATRSGLVDWRTGSVAPLEPGSYATKRIECEYDPKAKCKWWLQMLSDTFPDEEEKIGLLQEVLGVGLVNDKPRTLMRGLVLVGPSNAGKSQTLNVMAGLFSDDPNTTPFDMLENAHGLMPFLKGGPWLLHEAFDQAKWHFSATAKALLSGDQFSVNVKNGPLVTHRFKSPIFWGTNTAPQFKESSRAMEHRLLIVQCKAQFDAAELTGAAAEAVRKGHATPASLILAEEKPGVLNWALAGLRRAWERGTFAPVEEVQEALHNMRMDSNLVAGFIEECCVLDATSMVAVPDFCGAFAMWWQENKGEDRRLPSNDSVGRAVAALANPKIVSARTELRYRMKRYHLGIRLNDEGLDYWQGFSASRWAADGGARLVSKASDVNELIPPSWDDKAVVLRMRRAK